MLATLTIQGQRILVGNVWVHLQRPKSAVYAPFTLDVPLSIAQEVFGLRKPELSSRTSQIWSEVTTYGTFIVETYFKNMARLAKQQRGAFEWVIATVDEIVESEDTIHLSGKALPFRRENAIPELKPLE